MRSLIIILPLIGLFSGCTTEYKSVKYMKAHENILASLCASKYPITEVYIKGKSDTVTKRDTTVLPGKVIDCPDHKHGEKPAKVKCPDNYIVRDTTYIDRIDTIFKENTAKLASVNYELTKAKAELESNNKSIDRWRNIAIVLGLIAIAGWFIKR